MRKKSATTNHDGLVASIPSVFRTMAACLFAGITLREPSEADHACAMFLDQPVKNRDRVALAAVEKRFRGWNEIRQAQTHKAIPRSRL
jgi:hypothetical protein